LLSLNVNGLADAAKRRALFLAIIEGPFDVVCLQETHQRVSDSGERWANTGAAPGQPWPGWSFWQRNTMRCGTQATAGVATLIRDSCGCSDTTIVGDPDPAGRRLRVDFNLHGHAYTVLNVYAPCENLPRVPFFSTLSRDLPTDGRATLLCGDFNCIDAAHDAIPTPSPRSRRWRGAAELQTLTMAAGLTDAWRRLHPEPARDFTYAAADSCARLDRWLVADHLMQHAPAAAIVDGLPGDHRGVTFSFAPPGAALRVRPPWRFPLALLADSDFLTAIRVAARRLQADRLHRQDASRSAAEFLRHLQQPAPTAPPTPPTPDAHPTDADPQGLLEDLVACVSAMARRRQAADRRERRDRGSGLQRAVTITAAQIPYATCDATRVAATAAYRTAAAALAAHSDDLSRRNLRRARALELLFFGKPTHYFHARCDPRHYSDASFASMLDPAAGAAFDIDTSDSLRRAQRIIASHFTQHFASRPASRAAQDQLLASLDTTVTATSAAACDAPLTVDELKVAAAALQRGKSPGPDGLPSEVYLQLWDVLGSPLTDAFNAGHVLRPCPHMTRRQRTSDYTLVPKKGDSRDPANRRPIAGINADVKIAARAIATRIAAAIAPVIDPTQTGFLPGRWIGDNILNHADLVDLLTTTDADGTLLFLDFSKAFDYMDRDWTIRVMQAMRFGDGARRWARLFLTGTVGRARVNGAPTDPFPIDCGGPQGNPLSPLLFIIQVQPMLSHARHMSVIGAVRPIRLPLPDFAAAPICHQHADDTTIHAHSPADCDTLVATSVATYCAASGAQLNAGKTVTLLFGAASRRPTFVSPATHITYDPTTRHTKHLGIIIGSGPAAATARQRQAQALLASVGQVVRGWSRHRLSHFSRAYVGKQNLQSKLVHLWSFDAPDAHTMSKLETCIYAFFNTGHFSTNPRDAACNPNRLVSALPPRAGGAGAPALRFFATALMAKQGFRMLEPQPMLWKSLRRFALLRGADFYATHPAAEPRAIDSWGLGAAALISTLDIATATDLPPRLRSAIAAAQEVGGSRRLPSTPSLVMRDRLFYTAHAVADPTAHQHAYAESSSAHLWCLADLCAAIDGDRRFVAVPRAQLLSILDSLDDTMMRALTTTVSAAALASIRALNPGASHFPSPPPIPRPPCRRRCPTAMATLPRPAGVAAAADPDGHHRQPSPHTPLRRPSRTRMADQAPDAPPSQRRRHHRPPLPPPPPPRAPPRADQAPGTPPSMPPPWAAALQAADAWLPPYHPPSPHSPTCPDPRLAPALDPHAEWEVNAAHTHVRPSGGGPLFTINADHSLAPADESSDVQPLPPWRACHIVCWSAAKERSRSPPCPSSSPPGSRSQNTGRPYFYCELADLTFAPDAYTFHKDDHNLMQYRVSLGTEKLLLDDLVRRGEATLATTRPTAIPRWFSPGYQSEEAKEAGVIRAADSLYQSLRGAAAFVVEPPTWLVHSSSQRQPQPPSPATAAPEARPPAANSPPPSSSPQPSFTATTSPGSRRSTRARLPVFLSLASTTPSTQPRQSSNRPRSQPTIPPAEASRYRACWEQLCHSGIDRAHIDVAWRALHCQLRTPSFLTYCRYNNATVTRTPAGSPLQQACCRWPACSDAIATASHVLLCCPLARPAADWLCRLWAAIDDGNAPPATPDVIIAGDPRAWSPTSRHLGLWTRLRALYLRHAWAAHQAVHARDGTTPTPTSIAAATLGSAVQAMRTEFDAAFTPPAELAQRCGSHMATSGQGGGSGGVSSRAAFLRVWAAGSLCSVDACDQLAVHLTSSHPVPLPARTSPPGDADAPPHPHAGPSLTPAPPSPRYGSPRQRTLHH
jgi:exonuclease III